MSDGAGGARPAAGGAPEPDDGPVTLRLAVLLLWVEAGALGVLGLFELYQLLRGRRAELGLAVVLTVTPLLTSGLLAQLGRWLVRRRAAARAPAVVLQLSALPVAALMTFGEAEPVTRAAGVVIGLVTLGCAGLLLAGTSRAALTSR